MALGRRKPASGKPSPVKARAGATKAKVGLTRGEKLKQLRTASGMTRKADPKMLPLVVAAFVVTLAVFVLIGVAVKHPLYLSVIGLLFALAATAAVFGRRVQKTAFSSVEGQLGAAAAVLQNMRGNWRVSPAVGFTKEQDLLHRVVGRPGVVLVAEGAPNRTRGLVVAQKRQLARVLGETPLYDVSVGDGEGQVALKDLEKHFLRLPRNIKPAQVNAVDARLKALGSAALPIPKGPMPTRVPRGRAR